MQRCHGREFEIPRIDTAGLTNWDRVRKRLPLTSFSTPVILEPPFEFVIVQAPQIGGMPSRHPRALEPYFRVPARYSGKAILSCKRLRNGIIKYPLGPGCDKAVKELDH